MIILIFYTEKPKDFYFFFERKVRSYFYIKYSSFYMKSKTFFIIFLNSFIFLLLFFKIYPLI